MQWMSILKSNCAIYWTVIYPVNRTVHPLQNRGLMYFPCARTLAQPLALEMRATLCHLSKVPASLRWVFVLVVSSFLLKAWIFVSAIIILLSFVYTGVVHQLPACCWSCFGWIIWECHESEFSPLVCCRW